MTLFYVAVEPFAQLVCMAASAAYNASVVQRASCTGRTEAGTRTQQTAQHHTCTGKHHATLTEPHHHLSAADTGASGYAADTVTGLVRAAATAHLPALRLGSGR